MSEVLPAIILYWKSTKIYNCQKTSCHCIGRCWFSGTNTFSFEAHNRHIQANEETLSGKQSNFSTTTQRVNDKTRIQNRSHVCSAPVILTITPQGLLGSPSNTDKLLSPTCEAPTHKKHCCCRFFLKFKEAVFFTKSPGLWVQEAKIKPRFPSA